MLRNARETSPIPTTNAEIAADALIVLLRAITPLESCLVILLRKRQFTTMTRAARLDLRSVYASRARAKLLKCRVTARGSPSGPIRFGDWVVGLW